MPKLHLNRAWRRPMFIAAGAMMIVGVAPLTTVIIRAELGYGSDPNPNPVGLGILFTIRALPLEGEGAVYHVIVRGNERKAGSLAADPPRRSSSGA